ncbi:hypothetical protein N7491_010788 [Penicillium cf. griseofulvum]|uniref:Uncharacterized protein n=1 Tax=Penicillium cf. griseofulvum TaxID=2972120 RepID=A0A9W9N0G3_9EURO|nr:hypothetical protein N7472_001112 [Penicillium cf. griseofulvum]KAJ5422343.1 hypothetical protein N7491_010788 [Penicillium cf. griseofulvum]KAJ5428526.1 hypothetical protein N7445_009980 [Penicillium cf. griseofulvum]
MCSSMNNESESFGTETNPIVIEDDNSPLGSELKPIMIYFEDHSSSINEQLQYDPGTELIATPES